MAQKFTTTILPLRPVSDTSFPELSLSAISGAGWDTPIAWEGTGRATASKKAAAGNMLFHAEAFALFTET